MKLKIVSDGTPKGTKVFDELGQVERVRNITWSIDAGGLSMAIIELVGVSLETEVIAAGIEEGPPMRSIELLLGDDEC